MLVRTDLASEWGAFAQNKAKIEGFSYCLRYRRGVKVCEVRIDSDEAKARLNKQKGRYLTVFTERLWEDGEEDFREKVFVFAEELKSLLPPKPECVLLAGLGNRRITADAVGPESLQYALVTRHLKRSDPKLFSDLGLCSCAAIAPGVLGQTGMESAQILKGVTDYLRPDAVIVIDALAASKLDRLVTTVQLSDTGLSPGSGVGNRRDALDKETLGVPVCSVGVPTVVDAATLACDVLSDRGEDAEFSQVQAQLSANGLNYFVTPKETDALLKQVSRLIGYGINLALHERLSYEEMISLAE